MGKNISKKALSSSRETGSGNHSISPLHFFESLHQTGHHASKQFFSSLLKGYLPKTAWELAFFCQSTSNGSLEALAFESRARSSNRFEMEIVFPAIARAAQIASPCFWKDLVQEPSFAIWPRYRNLNSRSVLVQPCRFGTQIEGWIYLESRKQRLNLSRKEMASIEEASTLAGAWLASRSRLFLTNRDSNLFELGRQSGSIIHDLRNLLALMSGRLQLLTQEQTEQDRLWKELEREIHLGKERLEEWLGKQDSIARSEIDVEEILREAISRIPILRRHSKSISCRIQENESFLLFAKRAPLLDAFTNLLLNATDATRWGGEVEVLLDREGESIRIRISDSGEGIRESQKKNLFEAMRPSQKEGSVGLGLYSTRQSIERAGGNLRIQSLPGYGTSVWIELPLFRRDQNRNARILIFDDEEESIESLQLALEDLPIHWQKASNEQDFLTRVQEGEAQLAILDLGMPRRNGLEILEDLQKRRANLPLFLLAAKPPILPNHWKQVQILRKPLQSQELRAALLPLLEKN